VQFLVGDAGARRACGAARPGPCHGGAVGDALVVPHDRHRGRSLRHELPAAGFTRPLPTLCVALGYGLAFFFLSLTVEKLPVGVVYAVWSGAGVTLIALIGWLFLGQRLDAAAIVGMGLIVAGVVVLNLFSKMAAH
jgi:small multidrug resistance pump